MGSLAKYDLDGVASSLSVTEEPEHSNLGLPSSFTPPALIAAGLTSMADLEKDLCHGMCNNALKLVQHLLGARAFILNYKQHHIWGKMATTQAEAGLQAHSVKISKACWQYKNSCAALERLGFSKSDFWRYQIITPNNLHSPKSYLDEMLQGVGQGYTTILWIWCSSATTYIDDWKVNALQTKWFRSCKQYKGWEEQLVLLKREMTMALCTFLSHEEIWKWKVGKANPIPGMRGYAVRQSNFYEELAHQALSAFQPHLYDRVIVLQWLDMWLDNNVNAAGFTNANK
ncbi:hypothetical protein RHS03_06608, partial [Rhizoctonia solani]